MKSIAQPEITPHMGDASGSVVSGLNGSAGSKAPVTSLHDDIYEGQMKTAVSEAKSK